MSSLREGARMGPYVVERVMSEGRGGFSQVVVARDKQDPAQDHHVALKVARTRVYAADRERAAEMVEAYARSLQQEVETLRQLRHPGIVHIYPIALGSRQASYCARAVNIADEPWYFCMEYLAGGSIESLIKKRSNLPLELVVEIAYQVCMALDYLHARGYVHLDVKTSNILLRYPLEADEQPQAVLLDFGTAQKERLSPAIDGGSIVYLPPERVRALKGAIAPEAVTNKPAVDIYSLGVTLYRMLSGRLPFSGKKSHITTAILEETATRPSVYNGDLKEYPRLDALVMQMLSKDPRFRPTAAEVAAELDRIVPPPRVSPKGVKVPVHSEAVGVWKRATIVLALLLVLGMGASFVFWGNIKTKLDQSTPTVTRVATDVPVSSGDTPSAPVSFSTPVVTKPSTPTREGTPIVTATETARHKSIPTATRMPTFTPRPTHTLIPKPEVEPTSG